ncbi:hypothetical protein ACFPRL_21730 [Pseudoclavibacter helvolus]
MLNWVSTVNPASLSASAYRLPMISDSGKFAEETTIVSPDAAPSSVPPAAVSVGLEQAERRPIAASAAMPPVIRRFFCIGVPLSSAVARTSVSSAILGMCPMNSARASRTARINSVLRAQRSARARCSLAARGASSAHLSENPEVNPQHAHRRKRVDMCP